LARFKNGLDEVLLVLYPLCDVVRNVWDKFLDEVGDEKDSELKHKHKSEACSSHFPILL